MEYPECPVCKEELENGSNNAEEYFNDDEDMSDSFTVVKLYCCNAECPISRAESLQLFFDFDRAEHEGEELKGEYLEKLKEEHEKKKVANKL